MTSERAKYSSKQTDRALRKVEERKKARDEEKRYVEYRKQQILSSFQSTVGSLHSGDEAFPKRRQGSMSFGERKAQYLAIRRNARFATWIGQRKGAIEAKPQATPSTAQFTDHSALLPLVNGAPFWTIQSGNEADEVTDEDLPVDIDMLERVCNGDLTLTRKPFQKNRFNPFGAVQRSSPMVHCLHAIPPYSPAQLKRLQSDEDTIYPPHPPFQHLLKWSDKIQVTHYDPTDREQPIEALVAEDVNDIKREKPPEKK